MAPSPETSSKAAPPTGGTLHRGPIPRLRRTTACDTAFRIIARRALGGLAANHEATCRGDPVALHQMRIALTHLRTAILFFVPMVSDSARKRVKADLKWLNSHLGNMRDLDVAIKRLKTAHKRSPQATLSYLAWTAKRAEGHRHLARALKSNRYQRLVKDTSDWIERGSWSMRKGKVPTRKRASPIAAYSARKLTQWQKKLLKKSRKLATMDTEKRHRLRLLNKKLCYSIEAVEELFPDKDLLRQQAARKYLRRAQKVLGQLNDDARGHALASALEQEGIKASFPFLSDKREKRLIRAAAAAYRKLAALK
ncbi:CHAD domain-containing protein [Bradyrhizobium sp.]|uniref:CHAD domain-containing protein n=1 Tax=Bradyrhizobium sp. TaxID=376 RepID=UPI002736D7BF|nr:CHAD domain-containing protein [Bradyrhizobium sp.]MDP3690071.1 CHAD domain-containing protein [Bradyrhizobium sp.]